MSECNCRRPCLCCDGDNPYARCSCTDPCPTHGTTSLAALRAELDQVKVQYRGSREIAGQLAADRHFAEERAARYRRRAFAMLRRTRDLHDVIGVLDVGIKQFEELVKVANGLSEVSRELTDAALARAEEAEGERDEARELVCRFVHRGDGAIAEIDNDAIRALDAWDLPEEKT